MKNKTQSNPTMIRMSDALRDRVERYRRQVQKKTGLQVGFSAAIRLLVEHSLEREGVK